MRLKVSFPQLLTSVLNSQRTHYLTALPKCILNEYEKKCVKFLEECQVEGFCPTVETFQDQITFMPRESELPLKTLFNNWTVDAREEYLAAETMAFVNDNEKKGNHPYEGMVEKLQELLANTSIGDVEVLNYKTFPRNLYNVDVYRTSWYLPWFDGMTKGLNGGDFAVLLAPTKVGKTTFIKVAVQAAYDHNETVMVCSQEQDPVQLMLQMDAQRLSKSHAGFRAGIDEGMMDEFKSLGTLAASKGADIIVTPQVTSVSQLRELVRSNGDGVIKKVFIDGLNLMGNYADTYGSLAQTCSELKQFAKEQNIVIIAVTQTNRTGLKNGPNVGADQVAGSYAILMYADVVIAMSPIEENGVKSVYMRPVLNRHGDDSVKVAMMPEYGADGSYKVFFGNLPPDWSPDQSNISSATKEIMKANFEKDTGMTFETYAAEVGEEAAETIIEVLADDSNTIDIEGL